MAAAAASDDGDDHAESKGRGKGKGKGKKSAGARRIEAFLSGMDITYQDEVRYAKCKDHCPLPYDYVVYIVGGGIGVVGIIEYDGKQHFEKVDHFQADDEAFARQKAHDCLKNNFARKQGWSILRISYLEKDHIEKIVSEYVTKMREGKRIEVFHPASSYPDPFGLKKTTEDDRCCLQ